MEKEVIIGGRYKIEQEIAQGGFAIVYKGRDIRLHNMPVAVKQLKKEFLENETVLKMFQSEIKLSTKLRHPNIVIVHDAFRENNDYFVVFEYIDGVDLKKLILKVRENKGKIPFHLSAYILSEVCSALDYAHNLLDNETGLPLNIVHRDISPQNILISKDGVVKITDFGIAKARIADKEETHTGLIKGKYSYMSPEQISGGAVDRTSDLYSLGIVMYELLTNEKLFKGDTDLELLQKVSKGGISQEELAQIDAPDLFKEVLAKLLQVNKAKRYQEAREVKQALAKFLANYENLSDELAQFISLVFQKNRTLEEIEATATAEGEAVLQQEKGKVISREKEEERTIIDVIRITAYSYKRFFISAGIIGLILSIGFLTVDTFYLQKTLWGRNIYNLIYPPLLAIETTPPNAFVIIDGKPQKHRTPLKISKILPGNHKVEIQLNGYKPITRAIFVKSRKEIFQEGAVINLYKFSFDVPLIINSQPPGAKIIVNGKELLERTPTEVAIGVSETSKLIQLEIPESGFKPLSGTVNLLTGEYTSDVSQFFSVERKEGKEIKYKITGRFYTECELKVFPPDANLIMNKERIPLTNGSVKILLGYGDNILTVSKEGFIPENTKITITSGKPLIKEIELNRPVTFIAYDEITGDLIENAYVSVGGRRYRTGMTIHIGARSKYASFSAEGYKPRNISIDFSKNVFKIGLEREKPYLDLRIVYEGGEPVRDAFIYIRRGSYEEDDFESFGITDEDGMIRGMLEEGVYDIRIVKRGKSYTFSNINVKWGVRNYYSFEVPKEEE